VARTSQPYSVTCVTHDEAVLHCLNALAHFAEQVGAAGAGDAPVGLPGLAWPDDWERDSGKVTFHFSDQRRRGLFLGEATRLLSGKWTRLSVEGEVPA
jgi:hypothetical protein